MHRRRYDLESAKQTQEFSNLNTKTKEILNNLAQHQQKADVDVAQLRRQLESLRIGADRKLNDLNVAADRRHRMAEAAAEKRSAETQRRIEEANEQRLIDKALNSLFYPEIDERYSNIKDAAPGTFGWIFDDHESTSSTDSDLESSSQSSETSSRDSNSDSDSGYDHRGPELDNFGDWLRHQTSVYWINGKLGSGKSTLMAFIVNNSRTRTELEVWSQGHQLHILSFFFWRPGTPLQKSILGLLRSLLYQICMCIRSQIREVFSSLSIDMQRIPAWTERTLRTAIKSALRIAHDVRFCIFIDGLDEFTGDYHELVDLIFEIQDSNSTKICVSSRPEVQLSKRLTTCLQLRLQDLNDRDISEYVGQKLRTIDMHLGALAFLEQDHTRDLITYRAEGVFLWAVLVTQALLRGTFSGEDERTLKQRIEAIPPGINDLFQSLIQHIDEAHKETLALYLMIMKIKEKHKMLLNICIITATRLGSVDTFEGLFPASCQQTETQMTAYTAGLLQIDSYSTDECTEEDWSTCSSWFRPVKHSNCPRSPTVRLEEKTCGSYPQCLHYESRHPSWAHRSAFEFMNDSRTIKNLRLPSLSFNNVLQDLFQASSSYIEAAPSFRQEKSRTSVRILSLLLDCRDIWPAFPSIAAATADRIRDSLCGMSRSELDAGKLNSNRFSNRDTFWIFCAQSGLWNYVAARLHEVPPELYFLLFHQSLWYSKASVVRTASFFSRIRVIFQARMRPCERSIQFFCAPYTGFAYDMSCDVILESQDRHKFRVEMLNATDFSRAMRLCWDKDYFADPTWVEINALLALTDAIGSSLGLSKQLNMHLGIAKSRNRLHLQLPTAFLASYISKSSPNLIRNVSHHFNGPEPSIRLFCCPWRIQLPFEQFDGLGSQDTALVPMNQHILLVPRLATSRYLLQFFTLTVFDFGNFEGYEYAQKPYLYMKSEELDRCFEMVEEDVWINEQGLDATQQLLALACVRTYFRDLLRSIWIDSGAKHDPKIKFIRTWKELESSSQSSSMSVQDMPGKETRSSGCRVVDGEEVWDSEITGNGVSSDGDWSTEDCWESDEGI